jgi:general stress protein 26
MRGIAVADNEKGGEKLWEMIRGYRFAMFTTREPGDVLRSRPMTTLQKDFDGQLYFLARADADVTAAVKRHPQVAVSFGNSNEADFVCAAGLAEVDSDPALKKRLWNTMAQAWFPEGPDAPSVVVIRVLVEHGEYWDGEDNKLVQLVSLLKAISSGSSPRDMGEHRKVSM